MNYKEWKVLYMETSGIEQSDLDEDWEKEIKDLYEKAKER